MFKRGNSTFLLALLMSTLHAQEVANATQPTSVREAIESVTDTEPKEVATVEQLKSMFSDGKVSGQLRSIYAGYQQEAGLNSYATALGGNVKYELASLHGFNAAVAFSTSHDIALATGDRDSAQNNDELSSSTGSYTQMSEAYINYLYDGFNFRAGRQLIDTPLADSDDIRMIPNTFEAYVATYSIENLTFHAGNLQRWQGVDAGLDDGWSKTGEDGTWFAGVSYSNLININAWYYSITKATNASYVDLDFSYEMSADISLLLAMQYLYEAEVNKSGVGASIYGAMSELSLDGLTLTLAYNQASKQKGKESFSGFGGGTLFTNMDTMILDEIAQDRDAQAIVAGAVYSLENLNLLYAYGDFAGDVNTLGAKAHIVEQNIGFEYTINEEFLFAAIYVLEEDKQSTASNENDWNRLQVLLNYTF